MGEITYNVVELSDACRVYINTLKPTLLSMTELLNSHGVCGNSRLETNARMFCNEINWAAKVGFLELSAEINFVITKDLFHFLLKCRRYD